MSVSQYPMNGYILSKLSSVCAASLAGTSAITSATVRAAARCFTTSVISFSFNRSFIPTSPNGWFLATSLINYSVAHSENILQGKLHNSRVFRRRDLAENAAVEIRDRIAHAETVGNVERFCSKFQPLRFPELECSRERGIELPGAGAGNAAHADIS